LTTALYAQISILPDLPISVHLRMCFLDAKCLDSFLFEDHFCMVLQLYNGNLLNFVSVPILPADSTNSNLTAAVKAEHTINNHTGNGQLTMHQPK